MKPTLKLICFSSIVLFFWLSHTGFVLPTNTADGNKPISNNDFIENSEKWNKEIASQQVQEDIDILICTLKSNHPGLYDYQTEADFKKLLKLLEKEIASSKNVLDEYKIVSKIIAAVADAHTYAIYPMDYEILKEELLFPIIPTINNNEITIDGVVVQSINGYQALEILGKLQSFSNSDGNTIPYKNAFIEMEFPLRYFLFIDDSERFEVLFKNGERKTLNGKSYYKEGLRQPALPPTFTMEENKAIIKIPSWEDDTAASFNTNLKEMANNSKLGAFINGSIQKAINGQVEHLVIDLRGNKGGKSGPAAILLSYLMDKPFKYYNEIKIVSQSFPTKEYITNQKLVEFYESPDARNLIEEVNGAFFFKDILLAKIEPQQKQFTGTVEVLVDKYTLSVSTDLVAILKKNREVTITGDEIGGNLEHYCAGNYINLRLPNSLIDINIPLQRLKY